MVGWFTQTNIQKSKEKKVGGAGLQPNTFLHDYSEIETNDGVINKKLMLQ